jgi:hypothetical protein
MTELADRYRWVGEFPCRGQEAPQRALKRRLGELSGGVKSQPIALL